MKFTRPTIVAFLAGAITVAIAGGLAACSSSSDATAVDSNAMNRQLQQYQLNGQNVPYFLWSQYRQTGIDVETAQANGVATTTFFFQYGAVAPIKSCPSIGFPMASTSELTNPLQGDSSGGSTGNITIGQMDPNGMFTGQSSGTYVVCVTGAKQKEIVYWEGDVETEGGAAHWDATTHSIVLDGPASVVSHDKPQDKDLKRLPTSGN